MWYMRQYDQYVLTPGLLLPDQTSLRASPAVINGKRCYALFDEKNVKSAFGGEMEPPDGDDETKAAKIIEPYPWYSVRGPSGAPWWVVMPTEPIRCFPWGNVRGAPCLTDLGAIGWCAYNDDVLVWSLQYRHVDNVNRKLVHVSQDDAIWDLAHYLRSGKEHIRAVQL